MARREGRAYAGTLISRNAVAVAFRVLDLAERRKVVKMLAAEKPSIAVYSDAGTLSLEEAGHRVKFTVMLASCMLPSAVAPAQLPPAWASTAMDLAEAAKARAARHVPNHFGCEQRARNDTHTHVLISNIEKTDSLGVRLSREENGCFSAVARFACVWGRLTFSANIIAATCTHE